MTEDLQTQLPVTGWQIKLGVVLFGFSILLPLLGVPLVALTGLPTATAATISGVILVAAEVLGIVAVAVMGKSGYMYIRNRILGFFKRHGPPDEVSRIRYMIGLVMFSGPIVFAWIAPYMSHLLPGYPGNELTYAIVGDLLLLVSLFVLGGDFWDKLRALAIHGAKAVFPRKSG